MIKKLAILILAIMLLCPVSSYAKQDDKTIGVISLRKVFDNYKKTAQYDEKLSAEAKQIEMKRQQLEKEIEKIKASLEVLGKEERAKKIQELREKQMELRKYVVENMRKISQEREKYMKDILRDIKPVITEYARKHGYKIILNGDMLLYVDSNYDLTDAVVQVLNEQYENSKKQ